MINTILQGPAQDQLKTIASDSIDLIVTDPPYGYSFMNKDWDKAVVPADTWKECLRVLKPGAFAFIMSSPRQDVLCKMILNLIDAGFETNFTSLYWTYASGFPKAADVSKLVDKRKGTTPDQKREFADYIKSKRIELGLGLTYADNFVCKGTTNYSWFEGRPAGQRLPRLEEYQRIKHMLQLDDRFDNFIGEAEREMIGKSLRHDGRAWWSLPQSEDNTKPITKPATDQAKRLEGAYAGFQPKPALELILTVMKPLSEKTFVDQALSNGKGVTWLDDCRIPYQSEQDKGDVDRFQGVNVFGRDKYATDKYSINMVSTQEINDKGRFPANLLVEDDVLNDGKIRKGTGGKWNYKFGYRHYCQNAGYDHITEKAANQQGPIHRANDEGTFSRYFSLDAWTEKTLPFLIVPKPSKAEKGANNNHPTVKSRKLMSYLITMGSRQGDIVLDPFCGSGTVLIAAHELHRKWVGIELNPDYVEIANQRLQPHREQTRLL